MTTKLTYKLIATVGEETANGNGAFKQLEQFVNEHIRDGWTPPREELRYHLWSAPRLLARQEITGSCA